MIYTSMVLVVAAAVLAPLLRAAVGRVIPSVVFEILLGLLIGPAVLGLASPVGFVDELAGLGLALLMFLAGTEVDAADLRGSSLRRAGGSWAASFLLALGIGALVGLAGYPDAALLVAIALSTTALATLMPILRDRGILGDPVGRAVMSVGTVGEFAPIILIALLLTDSRNILVTLAFLAAFTVLVMVGMWAVRRVRLPRLRRVMTLGLQEPTQLPVRIAMLAVFFFALVAEDLGIDALLGAFCAGLLVRTALGTDRMPQHVRTFESKLEAVGFGLLVPFFFVVSGMRIDLSAMVAAPATFLLVPGVLAGFLLCRSLPVFLAFRSSLGAARARRVALLAGAALPLVVVVTNIGQESGVLTPAVAAALVGGGLVSVLVLPLLALAGYSRPGEPDAAPEHASPSAAG